MSNKDYSEFSSNSLKSYDKTIIVEELLEKLKAQGCFDAKRKQFLSEITNKSSYQNLHTKVETLATKFLETVRWPPSVQKHQLREQLRLHIQSTDQFNNSINRLIEQEVNCKIQNELKPMIESKACEYLEVNYDKWKQNMLTHIYETYKVETTAEKYPLKSDIKSEMSLDLKSDLDNNDSEVSQSNEFVEKKKTIKAEATVNQSSTINSSSASSQISSQSKYSGSNNQKSLQNLHSSFVTTVPPTMPPPIGLLPPPHRILPNNLFQPLPPPPPPMFLPLERFPPPPPPDEGKSQPPPPPPEQHGPNTPTEEYVPKFFEVSTTEIYVEKVKTGLLKTPEKAAPVESKLFSPRKMIWGQIVLNVQDISDDSPASDSEKNEGGKRRSSRRSPDNKWNTRTSRSHTKRFEDPRPKESRANRQLVERVSIQSTAPHSHQKSNEYTDVSSESFNEIDVKDVPAAVVNQKKPTCTSSSDDSHSSSSNDQRMNLIRKINKKKNKLRKKKKTPTQIQSSSSYSSSESSSDSSSSENSQRDLPSNEFRESQRGYRVFGRSQSEEKDMDISIDNQSPLDIKLDSPQSEVNLISVESVQLRKNQIKARLEEIDAKRSLLQKQQLLTTTEKCSASNTTSSSSTESSSENTSSSRSSNAIKARDKESKKSANNLKSLMTPVNNPNLENEATPVENKKKVRNDSEPEEGELSSESRAGSMKRENNVNISEENKVANEEETAGVAVKQELLEIETEDCGADHMS